MDSDLVCRASQRHGHVIDHVLQDHEGLRHAEAPEGSVGGQVGPAGGATAPQVGDVVGVVKVEQNLLDYLPDEEEEEEENRGLQFVCSSGK